jgi:hypothetical protein
MAAVKIPIGPPIKRYRFPPILGPAEDWPTGSVEWALRLANKLNYTIKNASEFGVEPIIPLVIQAVDHKPWKVWPENEPAGSIDRFFFYATGRDYQQIHTLISGYIRDDALARRLAAAKGKDESEGRPQGHHRDSHHRDSMITQGNSDNDLLRRLARDHDDIMSAYERGEFKTVRDAARAAGIKVDPTTLQILRRAWKRASDDKRATFLKEIK